MLENPYLQNPFWQLDTPAATRNNLLNTLEAAAWNEILQRPHLLRHLLAQLELAFTEEIVSTQTYQSTGLTVEQIADVKSQVELHAKFTTGAQKPQPLNWRQVANGIK